MIRIRHGMFETNSSSNNVFVFKDTEIYITKTVVLHDEHFKDTLDNMPNLYFNSACVWSDEDRVEFIKFLYKCGVETIKYDGNYKAVKDAIEQYKGKTDIEMIPYCHGTSVGEENMKKICFGTNVKLIVMEDWEWEYGDTLKEQVGEYDSFCRYRLS